MHNATTQGIGATGLSRAICAAYLVALAVLLLTDLPQRAAVAAPDLLGEIHRVSPVLHLLSFLLLSLLALAARWPVPQWAVVLGIALFAAGTELLQVFVSHRTAELGDFLMNLAGIGAFAAIYAAYRFAAGTRRRVAKSLST